MCVSDDRGMPHLRLGSCGCILSVWPIGPEYADGMYGLSENTRGEVFYMGILSLVLSHYGLKLQ